MNSPFLGGTCLCTSDYFGMQLEGPVKGGRAEAPPSKSQTEFWNEDVNQVESHK